MRSRFANARRTGRHDDRPGHVARAGPSRAPHAGRRRPEGVPALRGRGAPRAHHPANDRGVKLLVDNPLSPIVAERLREGGHDAVHVAALGMGETPDEAIFALSAERGRMVATLDGDFGTLLATGRAVAPSVILLRGDIPRPAADIARLLGEVLKQVTHSLEQGTVVVVEPGRIRVRVLPVER